MWILLVLVCIILAVILYLFIAPFYIEINTAREIYRLRFHWLMVADFRLMNDEPVMDLRVLWFNRRIRLFSLDNRKKIKERSKIKKQKIKRKNVPWAKVKGVLKSFKWNACYISVDTGSMQLNGILYPVFYLFSWYSGKNVSINFFNETVVHLEVKNSLARMGWAFLKS